MACKEDSAGVCNYPQCPTKDPANKYYGPYRCPLKPSQQHSNPVEHDQPTED